MVMFISCSEDKPEYKSSEKALSYILGKINKMEFHNMNIPMENYVLFVHTIVDSSTQEENIMCFTCTVSEGTTYEFWAKNTKDGWVVEDSEKSSIQTGYVYRSINENEATIIKDAYEVIK